MPKATRNSITEAPVRGYASTTAHEVALRQALHKLAVAIGLGRPGQLPVYDDMWPMEVAP